MKKEIFIFITILFISTPLFAQKTSLSSGNWNSGSVWSGGTVPSSGDNVVISAGHTVTIDIGNAQCNDLTIMGSNATLRFAINGTSSGITINGNVLINSGGKFSASSRSPVGAANSFVEHYVNLYGNLSNNGTIDFRAGSASGGSSNGATLSLLGISNSNISLQNTTYLSSSEEFGSININKTNSAKVVLLSGNLFMLNSSSVGPVYLTFISGIIETGNNIWIVLGTGGSSIAGASAARYVNGALGRGMNSSAGTEKKFDVGDADGYRPIYIRSNSGGTASGHYVYARLLKAPANTGSSYLAGGLDSVSSQRYYNIGYSKGGIATSADSMSFLQFTPTYKADDGVTQGATGLMVAYSTDNKATWNNAGPTNHVVDLSNPPTEIQSTSLSNPFYISAERNFQISLGFGAGAVSGPIPDFANAKYGPELLHQYDFWKAVSDTPTPLLVYIHGGGLTSGSKSDISSSFVTKLLAKKISVMSINYRLSPEVIVPNHYLDCARAIQYARYKAAEFNINPEQIGAGGSSAGALTSFWLGFHDDLKDSSSSDPVLRMSSRLKALTCWSGQTTVDKRVAPVWIGDVVLQFSSYFGGTIFGLTPSTMDTPEAYALQEMASPYNHVTPDDPAVWMYYSIINPPTNSSEAIHHINFGNRLKDKLDSLLIPCILLTPSYPSSVTQAATDFLDVKLRETIPLPVELISFSAKAKNGTVSIKWKTATEINSYKFILEREPDSKSQTEWKRVAEISASGNSNSPKDYSIEDFISIPGKYQYRLKTLDIDGSFEYSDNISIEIINPENFFLNQNFPNPSNPATFISYSLPTDCNLTIRIYNSLGQQINELINNFQKAGQYTLTPDLKKLSSGIYFYDMDAKSLSGEKLFYSVKKMIILK